MFSTTHGYNFTGQFFSCRQTLYLCFLLYRIQYETWTCTRSIILDGMTHLNINSGIVRVTNDQIRGNSGDREDDQKDKEGKWNATFTKKCESAVSARSYSLGGISRGWLGVIVVSNKLQNEHWTSIWESPIPLFIQWTFHRLRQGAQHLLHYNFSGGSGVEDLKLKMQTTKRWTLQW